MANPVPTEPTDTATLLPFTATPEDGRGDLHRLVDRLALAPSASADLRRLTLQTIKRAILEPCGVCHRNGVRHACLVADQDIALLQRALSCCADLNGRSIDREDAALLLEINGQTATAQNTARWRDFFVAGVLRFLVAEIERQGGLEESEIAWLTALIPEGRCCYRNEIALIDALVATCGPQPPSLMALRERLCAAQSAA